MREARSAHADDALDHTAAIVERLSALLEAGVPPGVAWAHLASNDAQRASRLRSRRTASVVIEEVASAYRRGVGAESTLALLAERLPPPARDAWKLVAMAWRVATESGAPLGGALNETADLLRDQARVHREIGTTLAGTRMSVRVVLALPFVGVLLANALGMDVLGAIVNTWVGRIAVAAAAALVLIARAWTHRMLARASPSGRSPGALLMLTSLGLRGGWSVDRSEKAGLQLVGSCPSLPDERAAISSARSLAHSAGIPIGRLLDAERARLVRAADARSRARVAGLAVTSLLPLGLCVLPAFVLACVVPVLVSLLSSALAPLA